jgi:hypothetical protein
MRIYHLARPRMRMLRIEEEMEDEVMKQWGLLYLEEVLSTDVIPGGVQSLQCIWCRPRWNSLLNRRQQHLESGNKPK